MPGSRYIRAGALCLVAAAALVMQAAAAEKPERGFKRRSGEASRAARPAELKARPAAPAREALMERFKSSRSAALERARTRAITASAPRISRETRDALQERVSILRKAPSRPDLPASIRTETKRPVRHEAGSRLEDILSPRKPMGTREHRPLSGEDGRRGIFGDRSVYDEKDRRTAPRRPLIIGGGSRKDAVREAPSSQDRARLPGASETAVRGSVTARRIREAYDARNRLRGETTNGGTLDPARRAASPSRVTVSGRTLTGGQRHSPSAADTIRDRVGRLSAVRQSYFDRIAHEHHYRGDFEHHRSDGCRRAHKGPFFPCRVCHRDVHYHCHYNYWWPTYWRVHYHWRPLGCLFFHPYGYCGFGTYFSLGYCDDDWYISLSYNRPYSYYASDVIYSSPPVVRNYYIYESDPEPPLSVAYDAVAELIVKLKYGDIKERRAAARDLGGRYSLRALYPLIYALEYDEDGLVRFYAARSLGMLGSRDALKPLRRAMDEDPEEVVRVQAADAVEEILEG